MRLLLSLLLLRGGSDWATFGLNKWHNLDSRRHMERFCAHFHVEVRLTRLPVSFVAGDQTLSFEARFIVVDLASVSSLALADGQANVMQSWVNSSNIVEAISS